MKELTITKDTGVMVDNDFTVNNMAEDDWVWLTINKFTVCIKQNDTGIGIDVYGAQGVLDEPIGVLIAYDDDLPVEVDA